MIRVPRPLSKLGNYYYDPRLKKMVPRPKKRVRKNRIRYNKGIRNIDGAYPGYIFKVNRVRYMCVEAPEGAQPSDDPIPIRIYRMPLMPRRVTVYRY